MSDSDFFSTFEFKIVSDYSDEFRDAILKTGYDAPSVIEPGRIHRFPGLGKKKGNTAGWCLLFEDEAGGCFGDWSSGDSQIWHASQKSCSNRALNRNKTNSKQSECQHTEASLKAKYIWESSIPADYDHPYLVNKRVKPYSARKYKGTLVLPVHDFKENLVSLQFIDENGEKRFLKGGRKKGCYIHVAGETNQFARIIICEGWATGCSIAEDESDALVFSALDAGNLKEVALASRKRWPAATILIAGDDDRLTPGNPGMTKARAAAVSAGASCAFPQWPIGAPNHLSDFNDLAVLLKKGTFYEQAHN